MHLPDHIDLLLIEREITILFDLLFDEIPVVDASDILDGNMLGLFVGKSFHEVPEIIDDSADSLSFFDLVSLPEGKYYLGGYLLWLVRLVRTSRDNYPFAHNPVFLGIPYLTLMGFLVSHDAVAWIHSCKPLPPIIVRLLDLVLNTAGFELDEEKKQQILVTRARYLSGA